MAKEDIYEYVLQDPVYSSDWHWITDNIALGSYPLDPALNEILDAGVTAILSLRMDEPDYDLDLFERSHVTLVEDYYVFPYDQLKDALSFLHTAIVDGHKVYVHCFAGMSRSPFVVACYLMLTRGIPFDEAVSLIRDARPIVAPQPGLYAGGILERLKRDRDAILGVN